MPPRAPPRKSLRTTNTVSYTGMTSAGAIAVPTTLTNIKYSEIRPAEVFERQGKT